MEVTPLQGYLLKRMQEAVHLACNEDKEALQELLNIATANIDRLHDADIIKLLVDYDSMERGDYHTPSFTIHDR